ncbi:MAG TPA: hypothetical protein VFW77_04450 [Candidatus Saccharimonadales bacterium]|nr:hypothetical protein [Candidatus Saccharimonadales bacterium]
MDPNNQSVGLSQGGNQDDTVKGRQSVGDDTDVAEDSGMTPPTTNSSGGMTYKEIPLPQEAEDTDLIEKEWVLRAKQIVEHTREDPHEQQRALSQMKADYMKKRYNKDIKLEE